MAAPTDKPSAELNEERLNAVIESTPDPFIIVDADGIIERVNRQAENFFGYTRDELVGESYKMLVPERFRERHGQYTQSYRKNPVMREMGSGLELFCLTRNDGEVPVEIGLSPVIVNDHTTIMVRFRDIRKDLQEQATLRQALFDADEANRTKTRFLAAASHDLRQPLQSISMYLGVLAGGPDEQARQQVIERAQAAVDTTNKLLNALLNITKLEAGKVQPEISAFNIGTLLDGVANTEAPGAQKKSQQLAVIASTATVTTDPALLEQLVTNLVANAIRYTPEGGHIVLGCRRLPGFLKIQVCDNGPGIPSKELDRIFDEYHQLESESRYVGKGLGLGLSIVKLIAELLDLRLEIKSTQGKGACFNVLVPRAGDTLPETVASQPQPASTNMTGTLLLVDDDLPVLDATRLFLEVSGFTVLPAQSAEEAMTIISSRTPDLIITDYGLGETQNGIELLATLRKALGKPVPAIIVTGDTSDMREQDARNVNCALLRKPVDVQALLRQVQELLATP